MTGRGNRKVPGNYWTEMKGILDGKRGLRPLQLEWPLRERAASNARGEGDRAERGPNEIRENPKGGRKVLRYRLGVVGGARAPSQKKSDEPL